MSVSRSSSIAPSSSVSRPPASRARASTAHLVRERPGGEALRGADPECFVLRGCHPAQQPRLCPGEEARGEGGFDARKLRQGRVHVGEILELARREAGALARVVGETREPEALPRAGGHEPPRDRAERPAPPARARATSRVSTSRGSTRPARRPRARGWGRSHWTGAATMQRPHGTRERFKRTRK